MDGREVETILVPQFIFIYYSLKNKHVGETKNLPWRLAGETRSRPEPFVFWCSTCTCMYVCHVIKFMDSWGTAPRQHLEWES